MPRKGRIEFPGAFYHLLDRGDRREDIVRDETDRARFVSTLGEVCARTGWRVHAFGIQSGGNRGRSVDRSRFLELLARACDKTGWQVHAYCLMSNHFHL